MDVNAAAAIATAQTQQEIGQAVAVKVLKLANTQQKSVLGLIQSAAELSQQVQANEPGKGQQVDVQA